MRYFRQGYSALNLEKSSHSPDCFDLRNTWVYGGNTRNCPYYPTWVYIKLFDLIFSESGEGWEQKWKFKSRERNSLNCKSIPWKWKGACKKWKRLETLLDVTRSTSVGWWPCHSRHCPGSIYFPQISKD